MTNASLRSAPRVSTGVPAPLLRLPEEVADRLFISLLRAYRRSGGLLSLKELLPTQAGDGSTGRLRSLPERVASREVLGIFWDDRLWLPAFQFGEGGQVIEVATAVFEELVPVFDAWELASWFISPSCWLQEQRPVDLLDTARQRVLEAARVDRYVAAGG